MKPLLRTPKNKQTDQPQAPEKLVAELGERLAQLTSQLLAANTDLECEINNRLDKESEFRRSTERVRYVSDIPGPG